MKLRRRVYYLIYPPNYNAVTGGYKQARTKVRAFNIARGMGAGAEVQREVCEPRTYPEGRYNRYYTSHLWVFRGDN